MKQCPLCNKHFMPGHGSQVYCTPECKETQKANVQKKLYSLIKEFRRGFIHNYKVLAHLLPSPGEKTMPLEELNNLGFKSICYFGSFQTQKRERYYKVGEFSFHLFTESSKVFIRFIKS